MTTLAVITATYPFGTGESFFGYELDALAEAFDRVVVIPERVEAAGPRPVPKNVQVDLSLTRFRHARASPWALFRGRRLARGIFGSKVRYPSMVRKVGLYLRMAALERWAISSTIAPVVWYSYWLTPMTSVLHRLRTEYRVSGQIVCRAHRGEIYDPSYGTAVLRGSADSADRIYCVSLDGVSHLRDVVGTRAELVLSRLGTPAVGVPTTHRRDGTFRVISISSLTGVKRIDRIAAAVARAAELAPMTRWEWIHIGDGPLAKQIPVWRADAEAAGVAVTFAGQLKTSQVYECLGTAHVAINLSDSEGIPVSLMEAFSMGVPAIATDCGGVRELVRPDTGFLLPLDGDVIAEASHALALCASNPATLAELAAGCKTAWHRDFSAETNFRRFARELATLNLASNA